MLSSTWKGRLTWWYRHSVQNFHSHSILGIGWCACVLTDLLVDWQCNWCSGPRGSPTSSGDGCGSQWEGSLGCCVWTTGCVSPSFCKCALLLKSLSFVGTLSHQWALFCFCCLLSFQTGKKVCLESVINLFIVKHESIILLIMDQESSIKLMHCCCFIFAERSMTLEKRCMCLRVSVIHF